MSDESECPFCARLSRQRERGDVVASFPDAFPLAPKHTLVVPVRHVESLFDLTDVEYGALWNKVASVRQELGAEGVRAFNIGVNDGPAAGQTVEHAHVHVIPRENGDTDDPRGGVRWVIPSKAAYWNHEQ